MPKLSDRPSVEEAVRKIGEWLDSEAGQKAVRRSAEANAASERELDELRRLDYEALHQPMTI